jgi:hypothetical protein
VVEIGEGLVVAFNLQFSHFSVKVGLIIMFIQCEFVIVMFLIVFYMFVLSQQFTLFNLPYYLPEFIT